jgi:DNA-binding MarR family transcriptional regulator
MGSHINIDNDVRAVLDGIRRIVQTLRESSRWTEKNLGLSGAQLFVLQKLAESSSQSLNELAARTHTHQSSVSTIVARLADEGLITRARSADDGRTLELNLSPRGRRLVERAPHAAQQRLVQGIQKLSAARRRALALALRALAQSMDAETDGEPPMFFEEQRRRRAARPARA